MQNELALLGSGYSFRSTNSQSSTAASEVLAESSGSGTQSMASTAPPPGDPVAAVRGKVKLESNIVYYRFIPGGDGYGRSLPCR